MKNSNKKFLVIGGIGKTGRRAVERLEARDIPVRIGSRAGEPPFDQIPHEVFVSGLEAQGEPADAIWLMDYLLATVLDGRNSNLADGVQRALGRPPRDFSDYVRQTAASGVWQGEAALLYS